MDESLSERRICVFPEVFLKYRQSDGAEFDLCSDPAATENKGSLRFPFYDAPRHDGERRLLVIGLVQQLEWSLLRGPYCGFREW